MYSYLLLLCYYITTIVIKVKWEKDSQKIKAKGGFKIYLTYVTCHKLKKNVEYNMK